MSAVRADDEAAYCVLIADDNLYVCSSLRKSGVWAGLRAEVRGTATSGTEALSLAAEIRPQIVITDIRMPGIDGLSLIGMLKERLPECQVIVITGYDDFRLAQAALRAGATDLILKPIRETEIERAARKAIELLEAGRRLKREVSSLKVRNEEMSARLENVRGEARRALLADLVFGRLGETGELGERLRSLKLNLRRFQILVGIGFSPESGGMEAGLPRGAGRSTRNTAAGIAQSGRDAESGRRAEELAGISVAATTVGNLPLWLVDVRHLTDETRRRETVSLIGIERLETLKPFFRSKSDAWEDPIIGVSGVHSGAGQVQNAYSEAMRAAEQGFFTPAERIFHAEMVPESRFDEGVFRGALTDLRARLSESSHSEGAAKAHSEDVNIDRDARAIAALDRLIAQIASSAPLGLHHAQRRLQEIARICGFEPRFAGRVASPWPNVPDLPYRSLEEARDGLKSAVRSRGATASGGGTPLESHHLEMLMRYLEANYGREVRLTDVASVLELSASHLSRLVRRGTGSTFTELLTTVRIRAATRLLRETNAKVYQIADMVGMPNHAYFHQVFRKHTGKAPNELR